MRAFEGARDVFLLEREVENGAVQRVALAAPNRPRFVLFDLK